MFKVNDRIYIDNCVIMNFDSFEAFFVKYGALMRKKGMQVTIPASVRKELARKLVSRDHVEKIKAEKGHAVLGKYPDLVAMEGGVLSEVGIDKVHADPEIIAMMLLRRKTERQLLLTNDRKLARDVYNLNRLRSCHGKPITVCYIDREGYIKFCDCMTETEQATTPSSPAEKQTVIPAAESRTKDMPVEEDPIIPVQSEESVTVERFDEVATEANRLPADSEDENVSACAIVTSVLAAGVAGYELHRHRQGIMGFIKWITKKAS